MEYSYDITFQFDWYGSARTYDISVNNNTIFMNCGGVSYLDWSTTTFKVNATNSFGNASLVILSTENYEYILSMHMADGKDIKIHYFDKNGKSVIIDKTTNPELSNNVPVTFSITSNTDFGGLSQLTVQGNNLSSVSYNNQNYTTFPTTLSLDSSATTLNVNGRVSSQRIN